MRIFSRAFLDYAVDRILKSMAQGALALLTLDSANVINVNWAQVGIASATYGLLSLLTSVVTFTSPPEAQ